MNDENTLDVVIRTEYKILKDCLHIKPTKPEALCELASLMLNFEFVKFILPDIELVYRTKNIRIQVDGEWAKITDKED